MDHYGLEVTSLASNTVVVTANYLASTVFPILQAMPAGPYKIRLKGYTSAKPTVVAYQGETILADDSPLAAAPSLPPVVRTNVTITLQPAP